MKAKFEGIKQILYVLLPLAVFVILYDVCTAVLQYGFTFLAGLFGNSGVLWISQNGGTHQAICIMGGLLLAFLCLLKTARMDGFLTVEKSMWKVPVWQYVLLAFGTAAVAYGMNFLFKVSGFMENSENYQKVAQNQYDVIVWVGLLLYGVVSPFVEEVIFRGFLYGRMRVYMPKVAAVLVSALLFGVYHGNLVQGIYGFVMAVLYTLVYEKYKNFYLAVFMHSITNLVAYFIQLNGFI